MYPQHAYFHMLRKYARADASLRKMNNNGYNLARDIAVELGVAEHKVHICNT